MNNLGNRQTMADNIQYYMNKYNKSRNDICNDLGFKYTTFSDWVNAKKYPRIDKIEMLANYFNIDKSDLVEERNNDLMSRIDAIPVGTLKPLPIIGRVAAGSGSLAFDDILGYELVEERYATEDYFFLRVVGDSMAPKIEENDLVLVHRQPTINSGNYAVVVINEEDGKVKRVTYGEDWIELHSINPYYPLQRFDGPDIQRVRIVGKVIEIKRKL